MVIEDSSSDHISGVYQLVAYVIKGRVCEIKVVLETWMER